MRPRDRVLSAINHQDPDRVPVDFAAMDEVWAALLDQLHLEDRESLLKMLGVDLRYIEPIEIVFDRRRYKGPSLGAGAEGAWEDIWGVWRRPVRYAQGVYQEIISSPLGRSSYLTAGGRALIGLT